MILTKKDMTGRIEKFYSLMNEKCPNWDIAMLFDHVNQYYFTGTMQNGVLIFLRSGEVHYFVRKSYKRAKIESQFENIHKMASFRDIPSVIGEHKYANGYIEMSKVPMGLYSMINKYLQIENVKSLDGVIGYQRSIKSPHEIKIMKEVGKRHNEFLLNVVPSILEEGMTELEFATRCNYEQIKHGHQGLAMHNMFQSNSASGELAFGENAIYPTSFDGPGGAKGLHPAQPRLGDAKRVLKKGDLIFVDTPFAMHGYNTDITRIYMFKGKVTDELKAAQSQCIKIQQLAAKMLKPNVVASDVYKAAIDALDSKYKTSFMGANGENVRFLGHGIGLCVDETPVLSAKFNQPLEQNMVIAIEPKISFEGVGLVGSEDTYIVTKDGGECITGGACEIIECG